MAGGWADDGDAALDYLLDRQAEEESMREALGYPEPAYPPDEVLFGDPRGEDLDREYEVGTVNVEDVQLLDRYGGTVL